MNTEDRLKDIEVRNLINQMVNASIIRTLVKTEILDKNKLVSDLFDAESVLRIKKDSDAADVLRAFTDWISELKIESKDPSGH